MIESDKINCITVSPASRSSQEWMGFFINSVPTKEDVRVAILLDITRLQEGGVEHEQDEAKSYRVALEVLQHSKFNHVDEEVEVAEILLGHIKCDRMDCFNVTQEPLRQA